MGANIVVCTSIDIDDYEDIHFEGVVIGRAGALGFETKNIRAKKLTGCLWLCARLSQLYSCALRLQ